MKCDNLSECMKGVLNNGTVMNDRWYCTHFVLFISTYSSVSRLAWYFYTSKLNNCTSTKYMCYPNTLVEKLPKIFSRHLLGAYRVELFFFLLFFPSITSIQLMPLLARWVMFISSATLRSPLSKKLCITAVCYFHIYDCIWLSKFIC